MKGDTFARFVVFAVAFTLGAILFVGMTTGVVVHVDGTRHVIRIGNLR